MAEHDTLAAFAVQLDNLRTKVATMEEKGPGEILVLASKVKKLSEALTRALGKNNTLIPQAPYWPAAAEYGAELGELRDWVNGFLIPQHPGYLIPGCWPAHREAVWELANLSAEWTRVYGDPESKPLDGALWFYERWMPGVRSRLFGPQGSVRCQQGSCSLQRAHDRSYATPPRPRR